MTKSVNGRAHTSPTLCSGDLRGPWFGLRSTSFFYVSHANKQQNQQIITEIDLHKTSVSRTVRECIFIFSPCYACVSAASLVGEGVKFIFGLNGATKQNLFGKSSLSLSLVCRSSPRLVGDRGEGGVVLLLPPLLLPPGDGGSGAEPPGKN